MTKHSLPDQYPLLERLQNATRPLLVLIGPSLTGKSTIGRMIAEQQSLNFTDTDELIENITGMSIPVIFEHLGEAEFRRLEAAAVKQALEYPDIVALGGGAVLTESTKPLLRDYQLRGGKVVFLDVSKTGISERLAQGSDRPLLAGDDALGKWQKLYEARLATYKEMSNVYLDTTNQTPQQVVDALVTVVERGLLAPQAVGGESNAGGLVLVEGAQPYEVVIGRGVSSRLADYLGAGVTKVFAIYPEPLRFLAKPVLKSLTAAGYQVIEQVVPDAEAQKTWQVAAACWEAAGEAAITRSDVVVAIGGGATTDLGGFIAATWLRGIAVVQVPTSLLAMVDAAVGGKTGINTPQGKNLVGSFHQPVAVLCDIDMLGTLPARDFSAGLAEVIKCGLIGDPVILDSILEHAKALHPWLGAATDAATWQIVVELIQRAVAVKARVTATDPEERGLREYLNYGHTLGHAIEHRENFTWRHGEAVAVGMVFAAELARLAGQLSDDEVARHREILSAVGLPVTYDGATLDELLPAMHRDKKTRGTTLRFITLDGIGNPTRLTDPPPHLLQKAYARVSSAASRESIQCGAEIVSP